MFSYTADTATAHRDARAATTLAGQVRCPHNDIATLCERQACNEDAMMAYEIALEDVARERL